MGKRDDWRISTGTLLALGDPQHRPKVIQTWEEHWPGWHVAAWTRQYLPRLIAERAAMIASGDLVEGSSRRPKST